MEHILIYLSHVVYYYMDKQNATFGLRKMTTYEMVKSRKEVKVICNAFDFIN